MYYQTHMTYYRLYINAYSICRRDYTFYYLSRTGWNFIPMRFVHYVYSAAVVTRVPHSLRYAIIIIYLYFYSSKIRSS